MEFEILINLSFRIIFHFEKRFGKLLNYLKSMKRLFVYSGFHWEIDVESFLFDVDDSSLIVDDKWSNIG